MTTPPEGPSPYGYDRGEERANVATHGIGALLALAGLAVLVSSAARLGGVRLVASVSVYGTMLVLLYSASTAYHAAVSARARHLAKIIDHASIYLLIAGTYTPFTLVTMRGAWGWSLFGTVWGLAALGVAAEAFWVYRPKWLSAAVYLAMGWMIVLPGKYLVAALPTGGLVLLLAGGLCYSLGTIFYVMKRVRYMHAVWHAFVMAGSACHFFAVILYVLPPAPVMP
jgi:hemolysin III